MFILPFYLADFNSYFCEIRQDDAIAVTSNFLSHCKCNVMFRSLCCGMFFSILHFLHFNSAVKRLIAINHIQNKSFCLHNICMCAVYIYVYINIHTYMYIFQKNMLCLYIKYIYL